MNRKTIKFITYNKYFPFLLAKYCIPTLICSIVYTCRVPLNQRWSQSGKLRDPRPDRGSQVCITKYVIIMWSKLSFSLPNITLSKTPCSAMFILMMQLKSLSESRRQHEISNTFGRITLLKEQQMIRFRSLTKTINWRH